MTALVLINMKLFSVYALLCTLLQYTKLAFSLLWEDQAQSESTKCKWAWKWPGQVTPNASRRLSNPDHSNRTPVKKSKSEYNLKYTVFIVKIKLVVLPLDCQTSKGTILNRAKEAGACCVKAKQPVEADWKTSCELRRKKNIRICCNALIDTNLLQCSSNWHEFAAMQL